MAKWICPACPLSLMSSYKFLHIVFWFLHVILWNFMNLWLCEYLFILPYFFPMPKEILDAFIILKKRKKLSGVIKLKVIPSDRVSNFSNVSGIWSLPKSPFLGCCTHTVAGTVLATNIITALTLPLLSSSTPTSAPWGVVTQSSHLVLNAWQASKLRDGARNSTFIGKASSY